MLSCQIITFSIFKGEKPNTCAALPDAVRRGDERSQDCWSVQSRVGISLDGLVGNREIWFDENVQVWCKSLEAFAN
jgi:hypothetical protein